MFKFFKKGFFEDPELVFPTRLSLVTCLKRVLFDVWIDILEKSPPPPTPPPPQKKTIQGFNFFCQFSVSFFGMLLSSVSSKVLDFLRWRAQLNSTFLMLLSLQHIKVGCRLLRGALRWEGCRMEGSLDRPLIEIC